MTGVTSNLKKKKKKQFSYLKCDCPRDRSKEWSGKGILLNMGAIESQGKKDENMTVERELKSLPESKQWLGGGGNNPKPASLGRFPEKQEL